MSEARIPAPRYRLIGMSSVLLAVVAYAATAQETQLIRGRVLDVQRKPVGGVEVTIGSRPSGVEQRALTDNDGAYAAIIRDPATSYLIVFRKVGFGSFAQTINRRGLSSTIVVPDVILPGGPAVLQPITATAQRTAPARGDTRSVGSSPANVANNALFIANPSDLIELARLVPGLAGGDSGISALGAARDQNRILVDGAEFGDTHLPRDAVGTIRVSTSSFDASKGRFAGAEMSVTTRSGTDVFTALTRAQLIHPRLAWADPESPTIVPRVYSASTFLSGPIVKQKLVYFVSFDGSVRRVEAPSLVAPRPALLTQLGVSNDTVTTLTNMLQFLGIPNGAGGTNDLTVRQLSGFGRLDYRPGPLTTWTFEAIPSWSDISGGGVSTLSYPTVASSASTSFARYMLSGSRYSRSGLLDEMHSSFSSGSSRSEPASVLPRATVRIGTSYPAGQPGITDLAFGGSGSATGRAAQHAWDTDNALSWTNADASHQLKFTQQLRFDWGTGTESANPSGTFTYQSLEDLAANRPASYSRSLLSSSTAFRSTTVAFSVGDIWRVRPGVLDLQGGIRFDATHYGAHPGYDPLIDSLFGVRTDYVPNNSAFSPRLGFSWTPAARRTSVVPEGVTLLTPSGDQTGMKAGMGSTDAGGLSLTAPGSPLTISGGIGAFRGLLSPLRVGAIEQSTGTESSTQLVSCVGPAVPVPNWSSPDELKTLRCASGSGTQYALVSPTVSTFDRGFQPPTSWRGNLEVRGLEAHGWSVGMQFTYSFGVNAESRIDLNMRRTPVFALPAEAGRSVYAEPGDIVAASGFFAPSASRLVSTFGMVSRAVSDLRYHVAQVNIPFAPQRPLFGKIPVYFVYTWTSERRQQRGVDGAAQDPFAVAWTQGQRPLHEVTFGATNVRLGWFTLAGRLSVTSGRRYTPLVAQDINGDGIPNDRAFIPNPASAPDTAMANQMQLLLAHAPAGARSCIVQQAGAIASTNSCRTPWRAQLDLNIAFTPPESFRLGNRVRFTSTLLNATGALVRLFGLQNTPFGQTAANTAVDQRLLYATAWDPASRQFKYQVNQLFGQPLDFGTSRRRYPPFELQIGLEYRWGEIPAGRVAQELGYSGSDSASDAVRVRNALRRRAFGPNPASDILVRAEALGLSVEQASNITAIRDGFERYADSAVTPLVAFVMQRKSGLTAGELSGELRRVTPAARDFAAATMANAVAFLLPEQRIKYAAMTRSP
jgi:hypothetical protein